MRKNTLIKKGKLELIIYLIVFIFFLIYALMLIYPLVWGFISSFKGAKVYWNNMFGIIFEYKFENYARAIREISDGDISFFGMFWNSIWFAVGSAFLTMEFTCAYSYVLAKYKFKGRNFLYGLCLFMISVPIGATLTSTYRLMYSLKLANSYLILITATNVYGMNLILFHSYWKNISWSYAEAAQIDGTNFYQIYFKAMRPQATPLMFTLGLMLFIGKWNDYMSPLLYLPKKLTLATGLFRYNETAMRTGNMPVLFAGLFVCVAPILVVFAIFQDKMMGNISIGGLKG